ncbi:MAG: hydantoinase B/oxoprolinase family protein [Gammaproteobacteria bacterium]|nr:hydantoinase B/oxoprolinase family protein [Gammaproteobacteria bacterium]
MSAPSRPRLAVDIGGTFTDVAIERGDELLTAKTLTTHEDPVRGVLRGIEFATTRSGLAAADFGAVIHGTTLATNALIERRGARVGAITTEGFRDILEIGYERRYDQYDMYLEKQDMLVPRDRVHGVRERIDVDGNELDVLDEDSVEGAIDALLAQQVDSVAVCLLHAYKNPAHERRIEALIRARAPGMPVSLSSEVSPEVREFDRMCTTVANAYIKPLMAGYLRRLEAALRSDGFACPLYLITSGGGMTTLDTAMRFPVRLVESGPSGGAVLAAGIARQRDLDDVVSFDMGGTTAKICLIEGQTPRSSRSFEIGRAERFIKGSGLPVRIPVIEMIEIGAGGGSIAGVDELGRLRVGPRSASSEPGPACYARGGTAPTVTDADVAIGYIDPSAFAEGRVALDPELAMHAIESCVAGPLGDTVQAAADGISQTVDEAMANAARMHAVEQGKHLGDCTMVAFGGNGPLHATRVAEKVGIERIVVPVNPSVGSAVGFLSAPVTYEIVRSFYALAQHMPFADINALLGQIEREARAIVEPGAPGLALQVRRTAFMRYAGQGHEIEIDIAPGELSPDSFAALVAAFEAEYIRLFGRIVPDMQIEIMNWSVVVASEPPATRRIVDLQQKQQARASGQRLLVLGQQEQRVAAAVYRREQLSPGDTFDGPALVVEPQTTTWVSPAFAAEIDAAGNILLTRRASTAVTQQVGADLSRLGLQVMWDRLLAIVEEQGQVLMRTAFSPIVRECGDISAGIFDLQGRMLAQAVSGTPGHINTMAASVALMLQHFALADMSPGDVYLTNDPWIGSGHLNDVLLVAPIFHQDRLVALTACTSHVYDLGGLGMGPDGGDVHDEGLFIPPLRLVEAGHVNTLVMDIMKANSRSPISNEGDFYALIACCDTAATRLAEMLREFGLADIEALGAHILDTSRRATEAAIAELPRGEFGHDMMIDGYDFEIRLQARLRIGQGRILTDFSGSSSHSERGINVPINYTAAYAVFALRCLIGADIPNNAGSLAPFEFVAPDDCILNAQPPAPVASRHIVGHMVSDLVLGCLHQAVDARAPAEGASCLWDLPIRSAPSAARDGKTGFATEFTHSGGTGARPAQDGLSATAYPSGVYGTQVEIAESSVPVRIRRRELIRDSGGSGQYRGGLGQLIELESSEEAPILLFAGVERTKYPARGRAGGGEGRLGRINLRSGPRFAGKGLQVIPAGDLLRFETPGGGGYGDPFTRDPARVADDVRLGLVSRAQAAAAYGVVLDAAGEVDRDATAARRARADNERLGEVSNA